jgi:hypothetical protein
MGTGTRSAAMIPSNVAAHWMPIPSNIWRANSGKAAPQRLRRNVFAAMAEAANIRYASTK